VTTYVALLRVVNVGQRKLAMADLRAICEDLGYEGATTYVNSGNVVFAATGSATAIERAMEQSLSTHCGFEVPTIARTATQWQRLVATNPFPKESKTHSNLVHLVLAKKPPTAARTNALIERADAGEQVRRARGALWIYYPNGSGRSKLATVKDDPANPSTARNWRTVLALAEMLESR
jgi:uncharacterized protein (DUF1697 family)